MTLQQGEIPYADRATQTVCDRRRQADRQPLALAERAIGIVGLFRLGGNDTALRGHGLRRQPCAADEPATAHGRADDIEIGLFGEELESCGPLPRNHPCVIEWMDEACARSLHDFSQLGFARRQTGLAENQLRAGLLDICNFRSRGIVRDDYVGVQAADFGCERDCRAVISRGMRCNCADVAGHCQWQNRVEGTTVFECAAMLEVFAFEDDTSVRPFVKGWGAHDGRAHQAGADEVCSGRDVCERGNGWHQFPA